VVADLLDLSDRPAALKDSVLLVIDCQNTYRHGVMRLEGVEAALAGDARLPARARAGSRASRRPHARRGYGPPYDVTAPIGRISDEGRHGPGRPSS
jgi:hypothetical protein